MNLEVCDVVHFTSTKAGRYTTWALFCRTATEASSIPANRFTAFSIDPAHAAHFIPITYIPDSNKKLILDVYHVVTSDMLCVLGKGAAWWSS